MPKQTLERILVAALVVRRNQFSGVVAIEIMLPVAARFCVKTILGVLSGTCIATN
jgi:hypothetical protein